MKTPAEVGPVAPMPWRRETKLLAPGIESTPGVCGGDACIVRTRIPVSMLVESRRLGITEDQLLDNYPTLHREDLAHAWAYAAAHPEEIERQIRLNELAMRDEDV